MNTRQIKLKTYYRQDDGKFREMNPRKFIHMNNDGEMYCDKDMIICQFTGLLDKNGKEIYEGDIVKHKVFANESEYVGDIRYSETSASFYFNKDERSYIRLLYSRDDFEVIGNIYENPELLK